MGFELLGAGGFWEIGVEILDVEPVCRAILGHRHVQILRLLQMLQDLQLQLRPPLAYKDHFRLRLAY